MFPRSPSAPDYPVVFIVGVVVTIEVRVHTLVEPPSSSADDSTVVLVAAVVSVLGGERMSSMFFHKGITCRQQQCI